MRTTRRACTAMLVAAALATWGVTVLTPGVASAAGCPTVNPVTHVVTPSPSPGVDWSGCDLTGADLSNANLTGADLSGATLVGATLAAGTLTASSFRRANLRGADLRDVTGDDVDFYRANLSHVELRDSFMSGPIFYRANMSYVDLFDSDVSHATFAYANLSHAYLYDANLLYAVMHGADLTGADMEFTGLGYADLAGVDLSVAIVWSSGFEYADLTRVNLSGLEPESDLTNATLDYANVTGTALADSTLTGAHGCALVGKPASLPTGWRIVGGCLTPPYVVSPFLGPVDSPPVVNTAQAGTVIAFRFTVEDAYGSPVTDLASAKVTSWQGTVPSSAPRDAIEWYSSAPAGLVNLGGGLYRFNVATSASWAGSCRILRITLPDGVPHLARFEFTG